MWGGGGGGEAGGRGGAYCFYADPVGVTYSLQSISLMNGWIFAKLTQMLMTLTLFSRSHEDLDCWKRLELDCWKRLENCFSAPYLLKEQMDFDHTCRSRLLGHVKELIRFW